MFVQKLILLATLSLFSFRALAQSTAFTYQGRLQDGGNPATGLYDFEFRLFDASLGGAQQGPTVTLNDLGVTNGLFVAALDFGANFPGTDRFLQISLRSGASVETYTDVMPRQPLTVTPYAIRAGNVSGSIADAQLSTNMARLDADQTFSGRVSFTNPANALAGDGSGLSKLAADAVMRTVTNAVISAWGNNISGQATVPIGLTNVLAVAGGYAHSLALKKDGTIVAWGGNEMGQSSVPAGLSNVVAVAGGGFHSLALKGDGTVVAWGINNLSQSSVPSGLSNVTAIAAGDSHSLALKSDGTVAVWGDTNFGQATIPPGLSNVVAVAVGVVHSLALKGDGTVVAWGFHNSVQATVPAGLSNVVAIAAGGSHSLALKNDGTVAAWGDTNYAQTAIPPGLSNVVAIAGGDGHSFALKADGTVVAWGRLTVPLGLSRVLKLGQSSVATHALVIRSEPIAPMVWPDADNNFTGNNKFSGTQTFASDTTFSPPASLYFGTRTRQMLNLWTTDYGVGVQSGTTYFRSGDRFSWFNLGAHRDAENDPGPGGVVLMTLNSAGLTVSGEIAATHFKGSGDGLSSLNASELASGTLPDARLSTNVALLNRTQTFTADQTIAPSATLSFGAQTRQMLNLLNADYGLGVQNSTTYFRSGSEFAWYRGGVHTDDQGDPGAGGASLMHLNAAGKLGLGTPEPFYQLDVLSPQAVGRFTTTDNANGAVLILKNNGASPTYLGAINFETANSTPGQIGYLSTNEMVFRVGGSERMRLTASGMTLDGTLSQSSDRNLKGEFAEVDTQELLAKVVALRLQNWIFTNYPGVKHVGPMAQDFHAAFGLGTDERHIATVDADGVALAAIQGLNRKLTEELQRRDAENAELKRRLERLEARMNGQTTSGSNCANPIPGPYLGSNHADDDANSETK